MNPSASGWIPKFLNLFEKHQLIGGFKNESIFYNHLKTTGFLYGVSVKALLNEPISNLKITKVEYTKINLFHTLLFTFFTKNPNAEFVDAIKSIINFYKVLEKGKTGLLYKLSLSHSPSDNLEHIISARLQETNSLIKKKSTSILTYTLLFVDVLTYRNYLNSPRNLKRFAINLENTLINCCFLALLTKKNKDKFDQQLINLFESSTDYLLNDNRQNKFYSIENLTGLSVYDVFEKRYILDFCCLTVWDDRVLDESEYQFLNRLTELLNFSNKEFLLSIEQLKEFSDTYSKKIKLFEYPNPLNQLYKQSSEMVKLLILRNKNRLLKELEESGELLLLLRQSTFRDLSSEEKNKIKNQLLDICKTVPSLTIFLIPGGSLLLPLLVKYIPSLLPSAFQENRIDKKS